MKRCIEIASKEIGNTYPNPLVGCVIVHENKIIGEGSHQAYGDKHAEVNAINSVNDKNLLKDSTLYVNLEPCNHYGKTPPCTDIILKYKILITSNIIPKMNFYLITTSFLTPNVLIQIITSLFSIP